MCQWIKIDMDKDLNIRGTNFRLKPDYPLLIFYEGTHISV